MSYARPFDTVEHARAAVATWQPGTGPRECSRGQAKRCASSKGAKCTCQCGGAHHGRLREQLDVFEAVGIVVGPSALADAARRP